MIKITPICFPESGEVGISEMSVTYVQRPDCLQDCDAEDQTLTITAKVDIPDEEDAQKGWFFRIKTDCWSIDDALDMSDLINDFTERLLKTTGQ